MESKIEHDSAASAVEDPDKDLQIIFKKLRVDCKPKRLCRKSRVRSHSWSEGSKRMPLPRKKSLIQEPTFVYKNKTIMGLRSQTRKLEKFRNQQKKGHNNKLACPVSRPTPDTLFTSEPSVVNQSQRAVPRGFPSSSCSGQFRRAQYSTMNPAAKVNTDDTTPDELAAYFELLHLPKPMSAMAEMMYT